MQFIEVRENIVRKKLNFLHKKPQKKNLWWISNMMKNNRANESLSEKVAYPPKNYTVLLTNAILEL